MEEFDTRRVLGVGMGFFGKAQRGVIVVTILICLSKSLFAEPIIRDEGFVVVGGVTELWQLRWANKPSPVCGVSDFETAAICPCNGFAYGEKGKLSLVRFRQGKVVEKMDLGPLFDHAERPGFGDHTGVSYLQRWEFKFSDWQRARRGDLGVTKEIESRPISRILKLADYNRDGFPTKFLLRLGNLPCGKGEYVALGVSAHDGQLHALTSAEDPTKPLIMYEQEWNDVLVGSGKHREIEWSCGDHGSDVENDAIVFAKHGIIHRRTEAYSCNSDGTRGSRIKKLSAFPF